MCAHRVLIVTGPTAVGKTRISLSLARALNAEIISADSTQVFKGLDIGTDKLNASLRKKVPHHLIDIKNMSDTPYNAGQFATEAREHCRDIIARGKTPIIVGGTGFYLRMLRNPMPGTPPTDPAVEARIELDFARDGSWEASHARLAALDPEYAARINRNDWYRLKRALAIIESTGRKVSSFVQPTAAVDATVTPDPEFNWRCVFLSAPRLQMMQRIDDRCEQIVERGLVEETVSLMARGMTGDSHVGKFVGYRQAIDYLSDEFFRNRTYTRQSRTRAFQKFLRSYQATTRQLHRRQVMWFRGEPDFHWVKREFEAEDDEGEKDEENAIADSIVQYFESDMKSNNAQLEQTEAEKEEVAAIEDELHNYVPSNLIYTTQDAVMEKVQHITHALEKHRELFNNHLLDQVLEDERHAREQREKEASRVEEERDDSDKSTRQLRWETNVRRIVKQHKHREARRREGRQRQQSGDSE